MTKNELVYSFMQLAQAVKYCHDNQVMLKGLKSNNIFCKSDGTLKIGELFDPSEYFRD